MDESAKLSSENDSLKSLEIGEPAGAVEASEAGISPEVSDSIGRPEPVRSENPWEETESAVPPEPSKTPIVILALVFLMAATALGLFLFQGRSLRAAQAKADLLGERLTQTAAELQRQIDENKSQTGRLQAQLDAARFPAGQVQVQRTVEPAISQPAPGAGLVILKATYGVTGRTIDATAAMQSLVKDNAVKLLHNWNLGQVDPASGQRKKVTIQYRYQNQVATAMFHQDEDIVLPVPQ